MQALNTVDIGEKSHYSSASGYTEFRLPITQLVGEGYTFLIPQRDMLVVSANIDFPPLNVVNETVPTFIETNLAFPGVSYRNPVAVEDYLARYPEIEGFIEAAWPALVECFDDAIEIVLEVLTYPADETIQEELVGWIQSTDEVDEGLAKLDRFEDEWYLDHMSEVGNKFNFNIETR